MSATLSASWPEVGTEEQDSGVRIGEKTKTRIGIQGNPLVCLVLNPKKALIPSEDCMILRLTTLPENARSALECDSEAAALKSKR